ncbi:hypothetical protein ACH5RR_024190 [Cinchona calisaya]|uniref:TF-B3 domain-containing protein n=1 Tax=Cinchona calisaya TaxID=153742 RepID=A0ABD2ZCW9_9GENT
MIKTIKLFGVEISADVDDEHNVVSAPAPATAPAQHEGGAYCCLINEKRLEKSDVDPAQSRFHIPWKILQELSKEERDLILNEKESLAVKVTDNRGGSFDMVFKHWPSSNQLVLNQGWMKLVKENQLKKDDTVALWCYRQGQDSRLCFAVDILHQA